MIIILIIIEATKAAEIKCMHIFYAITLSIMTEYDTIKILDFQFCGSSTIKNYIKRFLIIGDLL